MTLEEAIQHCEEKMIELLEKTKDRNASDPVAIECFECADEHRQLAEWLKDYKRLLEQPPLEKVFEDIKAEITNERDNKGFCVWYYDDLMKKINKHISGKEQSE